MIRFATTAALMTFCAAHYPHDFWFKRRMAMGRLDGGGMAVLTDLILQCCGQPHKPFCSGVERRNLAL
ncbi:MAG: hypothetical protein DWH91_19025 [Planctomycetota bacterium]|nr:MAG: hypothetical protein DWH91_19025 [Planctomycetota bacterium]